MPTNNPFTHLTTDSCNAMGVRIWIAGDYDQARQACREYCSENPACVSIERIDYIYTGGEETGVCVNVINYARYPTSKERLTTMATELGNLLMKKLNQNSFSLEQYGMDSFPETQNRSVFHSRKKAS